ncbi:cytochrome c oxidase subunit IVB [Bacillus sp. 03113]|uniref:cytochrome c oxidase subunit IVB n=1 Tax=Bacillus sp. 03113 TaxID=2578211 RepID=UPI0011445E90|nr:cytochrome c oxidase subunit IVB [Bacillus sp. 03113]
MGKYSHLKKQPIDIVYRRKKSALEMKQQVITFGLMIFLTIVAFMAVAYDEFSGRFVAPFIILLAVVQVIYQLYYFMHMKHKGHEAPALFIYSGLLVGFITILTFLTIVWL